MKRLMLVLVMIVVLGMFITTYPSKSVYVIDYFHGLYIKYEEDRETKAYIKKTEKRVESLPEGDVVTRCLLYNVLAELVPNNVSYKDKRDYYCKKRY